MTMAEKRTVLWVLLLIGVTLLLSAIWLIDDFFAG